MADTLMPIPGEPGWYYIPALDKKVKIVDTREDNLYDSVQILLGAMAAGTMYPFFVNVPMGKLRIDTNFTTPGKVPAGTEMAITRCGIEFSAASGDDVPTGIDLKKVICNAYLTWMISNTSFAEGPATAFPSPYGPYGNTVENGQSLITNGVPSLNAGADLKAPQDVAYNHDLRSEMTFFARPWAVLAAGGLTALQPVLTHSIIARAYLHGIMFRAATY